MVLSGSLLAGEELVSCSVRVLLPIYVISNTHWHDIQSESSHIQVMTRSVLLYKVRIPQCFHFGVRLTDHHVKGIVKFSSMANEMPGTSPAQQILGTMIFGTALSHVKLLVVFCMVDF